MEGELLMKTADGLGVKEGQCEERFGREVEKKTVGYGEMGGGKGSET